MNNISCHLIGLNPYNKKELVDMIPKTTFNVIDLDNINMEILKTPDIDKMYKQYIKLKEDKNDKFKEVDKKMSLYWENNFIDMIQDQIKPKKINILIGQNNHYKSLTKRVPIDCTNKFIIKSNDTNNEVKAWIKYNLETYQEDIINGNFPLEYINYGQLYKKRESIETTYKKIGYIEKSVEQVKTMLELIEKTKKTKGSELWISMKEPYNVSSLIHPKNNNMITAYNDPTTSLLASMNITGNIDKTQKIPNSKKFKTRRFIYMVDSNTFISEDNNKFFSQVPVKILAKQKIDSVYDFLINDKLK
jgi:hypothetical protein